MRDTADLAAAEPTRLWWPIVGGPLNGREYGYPPFEMVPGREVRFGKKKKTAVYRVSKDGTRLVWAADHRGAKA